MLGEPVLRRVDAPGEYWRYALDGCAVDLFFFPDQSTREERVTWYEARSLATTQDRCASFRARHGGAGSVSGIAGGAGG